MPGKRMLPTLRVLFLVHLAACTVPAVCTLKIFLALIMQLPQFSLQRVVAADV